VPNGKQKRRGVETVETPGVKSTDWIFMRIQKIALSTVLAVIVSTTITQAQVFSFSALSGANIQFNGTASTFQFNNAPSGNQFSITLPTTSSAFGLQGSFTGGPWSYDAVVDNGFTYLTANVPSQTAVLNINDGAGHTATADVQWVQLDTFGSDGGINANAVVDLSNLSYLGSNPDLVSFFSSAAGVLSLSFQFDPGMTLSDLTSGSGPYTTSFSGTLTPTPEPGSLLVAGLGCALLLGRRVFKR
jgi:hypothetical protein